MIFFWKWDDKRILNMISHRQALENKYTHTNTNTNTNTNINTKTWKVRSPLWGSCAHSAVQSLTALSCSFRWSWHSALLRNVNTTFLFHFSTYVICMSPHSKFPPMWFSYYSVGNCFSPPMQSFGVARLELQRSAAVFHTWADVVHPEKRVCKNTKTQCKHNHIRWGD